MVVQCLLAIHWPALQKLEIHLSDGQVRMCQGPQIASVLESLHGMQVPVLFMQTSPAWHDAQLTDSLSLARRYN
jgi:hypothetical protein